MDREILLNIGNKTFTEATERAFSYCFAVREFLLNAIVNPSYNPSNRLQEFIHLTNEATELIPYIKKEYETYTLSKIHLLFLFTLSGKDFLIDLINTDYSSIIRLLNSEIIGGKISYPWLYGHVLHDKYYHLLGRPFNELSYSKTDQLLKSTPKGVFQIHDLIVGPFGLLHSNDTRYHFPIKDVPLWHCPDPTCNAIHPVRLFTGIDELIEASYSVRNHIEKTHNTILPTVQYSYTLLGAGNYDDDMNLNQFPWLLANAFSENELRLILERLINSDYKDIRQLFPKNKQFNSLFTGSGHDISQRLQNDQCLQLILLAPNTSIINCIESLVDDKSILIPATEIRTSIYHHAKSGWLESICRFSQFGMQIISQKINIAATRLKCLLLEIYKNNLQNLDWALRKTDGLDINNKLDKVIYSEDPKTIINSLIFNDPKHIQMAFDFLRFGRFYIPTNQSDEDYISNKILWKLGFDIATYPNYQQLFWQRFESFVNTVNSTPLITEQDEDKIRSMGVNFFISLEEILDYTLSFATWLLFSDHFKVTQFKFNLFKAREFTCKRLNGLRLGSNEPLALNPDGKNTLYTLIQSLSLLSILCNSLISKRRKKTRRPETDLPWFYKKTEIMLFPFIHTEYIYDINEHDRTKLLTMLSEWGSNLESCNICDIRNRLEHKRIEFPNKDEVINSCEIVAKIANEMEESGIFPSVYLYKGSNIDQYKRIINKYSNYKGSEVYIAEPSQFQLCNLPPYTDPQIIVPSIHIANSSQFIRFRIDENSDYANICAVPLLRLDSLYPEKVKEFISGNNIPQ